MGKGGAILSKLAVSSLGILLVLQSACSIPRYLARIAPGYQSSIGKIAVVDAAGEPAVEFKGFPRGKGGGAAKGAGKTFAGCAGGVLQATGGTGVFFFPIWLPACGVVSAAGGAAEGISTPSADTVRSAEDALLKSVDARALQEGLRDRVEAAMGADGMTPLPIPPAALPEGTRPGDYRLLASAGIDTVAEVKLVKVGANAAISNDRYLVAFMVARVRVLRTSDNREVFSRDYTYFGDALKLTEWSANEAEALRSNLETGSERLGAHIADSLLLVYPYPDRLVRPVGDEWYFGLEPIDPPIRHFYSQWPAVRDGTPTLRWQAFPRDEDIKKASGEMTRVRDVRYELIIARERNGEPAEVVYERRGLRNNFHKLEAPLEPGRYYWSVRARFDLDGRERVTEWSSTGMGVPDQIVAPSALSYQFTILEPHRHKAPSPH